MQVYEKNILVSKYMINLNIPNVLAWVYGFSRFTALLVMSYLSYGHYYRSQDTKHKEVQGFILFLVI